MKTTGRRFNDLLKFKIVSFGSMNGIAVDVIDRLATFGLGAIVVNPEFGTITEDDLIGLYTRPDLGKPQFRAFKRLMQTRHPDLRILTPETLGPDEVDVSVEFNWDSFVDDAVAPIGQFQPPRILVNVRDSSSIISSPFEPGLTVCFDCAEVQASKDEHLLDPGADFAGFNEGEGGPSGVLLSFEEYRLRQKTSLEVVNQIIRTFANAPRPLTLTPVRLDAHFNAIEITKRPDCSCAFMA